MEFAKATQFDRKSGEGRLKRADPASLPSRVRVARAL